MTLLVAAVILLMIISTSDAGALDIIHIRSRFLASAILGWARRVSCLRHEYRAREVEGTTIPLLAQHTFIFPGFILSNADCWLLGAFLRL